MDEPPCLNFRYGAAVLAALDIIETESQHVENLWENAEYMRNGADDGRDCNAFIKGFAAAFGKQLNFTSVHTLSPHDPTLLALARLPIAVPFHSIIGRAHDGPIESASDGVVPFTSAHLDGASSELVVRSGHDAFNNLDAQREVIRILRLELQHEPALTRQ
jgi:hypothetical protein